MATFSLWNRCNSNCIMCTNYFGYRKEEHSKIHTKDKVLKRIEKKRNILERDSSEIIQLTGGEPTIHPDFFEIISEIRSRFPKNKIVIITNGRRFIYEDFTKELLKIKNLNLQIAVHGPDSKTHDSITRTSESFNQTIQGLKNIFKNKSRAQKIEIRHILLKLNYKKLNKTYKLISKNFPQTDRMVTIFPEYEGRAEKNIKDIGISYEEVTPFVERAIKKWGVRFKGFYLYNFPLCVINSNYWKHVKKGMSSEDSVFKKECDRCSYKERCAGINLKYKNNFGDEEFQPL